MLNKIIQIFKISELRNKILFILGIFVIFRMMANIPVPGIDAIDIEGFLEGQKLFGILDLFTGGALEMLSIVMLGLGPYITAVIIMQLLTLIFPRLKAMYKEEGEAGRKKFNQYGRLLTVPFAALQSYGMLTFLQLEGAIAPLSLDLLLTAILTITAATILLMWFGELITEKGIGNGISMLILAGILAWVPMEIREVLVGWDPAEIPDYLLFFGIALVIIAGAVLINEGRRNIPVSYAKRVRGMKMYGGVSTYLPLQINPAGVMPIIFAISIILLPGIIVHMIGGIIGVGDGFVNIIESPWFDWFNAIFLFILVVLFTYFYTAVTFDPKTIATNLQKMGGFIPGVRPGQPTINFIYFILNRVLLVGALFLGLMAIMPPIVAAITGVEVFDFLVGGTAVLIMVTVILESMRQIKAQLQMREYETF